jgi:hypothetical protein
MKNIATFYYRESAKDAEEPNPFPEWLPEKSWHEIVRVSNELEQFKGLKDHIKSGPAPWRKFYDSGKPHECDFPDHWNELQYVAFLWMLLLLLF